LKRRVKKAGGGRKLVGTGKKTKNRGPQGKKYRHSYTRGKKKKKKRGGWKKGKRSYGEKKKTISEGSKKTKCPYWGDWVGGNGR